MTNDKDSAVLAERVERVTKWLDGGCSTWGTPAQDIREVINALRHPTQIDALSRFVDIVREAVIEECAKALEADAKQCDCFARNEGECGCGAWCEWKSITSARAVEIVRALQKQS